MALITKRIRISGMSCINCQKRIAGKLRTVPGIREASVSYRDGKARIVFDPAAITSEQITKIIDNLGYKAIPNEKTGFGRAVLLSTAVLVLYILLEKTGILNLLVPGKLAESGMGYGMLFVVGLLTSVHCIAMCGGINLSQCLPGSVRQKNTLLPSLCYNAGRVISYTVIGLLLGLIGMLAGGSGAGIPVSLQGILKLAAGAVMVIMGVNMLGIFPWLRRINLRMPGFISRCVQGKEAHVRRPFIIGLLNGLMPCGPLQSMQILALASGNPIGGALSMLCFSLGTVPLMLGLGTLVSVLGRRFSRIILNAGAVLVSVLGLAMLTQGGSLSGMLPPDQLLKIIIGLFLIGIASSIPFSKKLYRAVCTAAAAVAVAAAFFLVQPAVRPSYSETAAPVERIQQVESILQPYQYPTITVQAGIPVEWNIQAPDGSINGCNYRVFIPEYGIELAFAEGDNIIRFTPTEPGEFYYTCWMGMIRGKIVVV